MISVIIEGERAEEMAQKLISASEIKGELREKVKVKKENTRLIDFIAVVDFLKDAAPIIKEISIPVQLAYTLWKWRRELTQEEVTIVKSKDKEQKELPITKNSTSVEEIEQFLKDEDK